MSIAKDFVRGAQLMFFGCFGGSRRVRQTIICQWLIIFGVIYLWSWYNGGLLPVFISSTSGQSSQNKYELVHYFRSRTEGDGLRVTWLHGANSRKAITDAVHSDVMMVEGDVLLRGQGTDSQQLVPVMAHPPQTDSDITLYEWLNLATKAGKGIKLDFKSIESVDLGLQILKESKAKLSVPVHLSAEVAEGPNSFMAPNKHLDPRRFIKQCKTAFPESTLALGWTNGWSPDGVQIYSWSMVKAMHDIVADADVNQALTFNVRAKLVKNSLMQLKWLMEMTGGTITLFSPRSDSLNSNEILNVRHRLPKDKVYYDIDGSIKAKLEKVPLDGGLDERQKFQLSQWKAVHSKDGEKIYLGSEALIFQNGFLISREEFHLEGGRDAVTIEGQVEFINIPTVPEDGDSVKSPVGLGIFLRVSQGSVATILSGIRCFIGFDGHLEISTQSIPGMDRKQEATVSGTLPCFSFVISDYQDMDKIVMTVSRLQSCSDIVQHADENHETKIEFSMKDIEIHSHYMAIRAPSTQAFTVVDHFIVT